VYIPIELCFGGVLGPKHVAHVAIDFLVDALFLCDIGVNFRTVYYNSEQELVLEWSKIRSRYLKSWFPLDVVASLPYDVITYAMPGIDEANLGYFGLLKLPRLLRLGRLLKKLDQLSAATAVRVLYIVFSFMLFSHWLSCIWWILGVSEVYGAELHASDAHYGVPWLARVPGAELSPSSSFAQAYLSSLFCMLTVLTKSPWIGPDTLREKVFMSIIVCIGAVLWAVLLTFVSSLTRQSNAHSAAKRDQLARMRGFANQASLSAPEARRLVDHVDAFWDLTAGINDNAVLSQVPSELRTELVKSIHEKTIHFSSLFSSLR
jgi:ABC-type multidrug transport system fused ATPase/permease subunit